MFISQRVPQKTGERGSLKWVQRLIELNPQLLTDSVRTALNEAPDWTLDWISPRKRDGWAEYRDAGFLLHLDLPKLIPDLKAFWPPGGPQWDALGKSSNGDIILVEAKAHFDELTSQCGAGAKSRALIDTALAKTKRSLGAPPDSDWAQEYYQYANRLAHVTFLRQRGVKAWLVFLYFYGDTEMSGPNSPDEWQTRLKQVREYLGYRGDPLSHGVIDVFLPVDALATPVD